MLSKAVVGVFSPTLKMGWAFFILLCTVCLNNGCVFLAGYGVYKVVRKVATKAPAISKEEKLKLEYNEIEGSKDEVLKSVEKVLDEWGYKIVKSDYKKGIIIAVQEDRGMNINVNISDVGEGIVGLKINITERKVMVENQRLYESWFQSVKANLNKDIVKEAVDVK